MRDTHNKSLRREFLGIGLTGAMAGLAGCSNVIGSDGEGPNIDTAGFSFSYDEATKQVQIEFVGGAAIDAGNVRIQSSAGREVLWAELGSTTAGVDEDIEADAVAVLGPNILNWETAIEAGETIRLIYAGKETPTTLEKYTTSEPADSENESQEVSELFIDDFDYGAEDLQSNGWTVNGDFSIESSQLMANSQRSADVLYRSFEPSFSGTWKLNGVQNNSEGRGLYIEFVRDPTADNLTGYRFVIQQLPDGIGEDYVGTNVDLYRANGGTEGDHLLDPSYDHDGDIHDYQLKVDNNKFELYIDSEKMAEATDDIFTNLSYIRLRFDGDDQNIDKIEKSG